MAKSDKPVIHGSGSRTPAHAPDGRGILTPKEKVYADTYLVNFNFAEAQRAVGFKNTNKTHVIVNRPHVKKYIEDQLEARSNRLSIDADTVVQELAKIAFAKLGDVLDFGPDGTSLRSLDDIPEAAQAAISEIIEVDGKNGKGFRVKMHSKLAALEALCKHLNLYENEKQTKIAAQIVVHYPDNGRLPSAGAGEVIDVKETEDAGRQISEGSAQAGPRKVETE